VPILQTILGTSKNVNSLIYAVIWGTLVYLTILSFILIKYKPLFGLTMFSIVAGAMFFLFEFY